MIGGEHGQEPFGGDIDADAPFVIRRVQAECESEVGFPQGVGGTAADEYIAKALKRMRNREESSRG